MLSLEQNQNILMIVPREKGKIPQQIPHEYVA